MTLPLEDRVVIHRLLIFLVHKAKVVLVNGLSVLVNDGRRHTSTVFFVLLVVVLNLLTDLVVGCARRQFLLVSLNMTRS